jgi:hypothetical protein
MKKKVHIACTAFTGTGDDEVFCRYTCAMGEASRHYIQPTELIPADQHEEFLTEMVRHQLENGFSLPNSSMTISQGTLPTTYGVLYHEAVEGDKVLTQLMPPF